MTENTMTDYKKIDFYIKCGRSIMHFAMMLVVCFVVNMAEAQTIVWAMKPTAYTDIKRVGTNLYMVTYNGKVGLLHADGTVVAPIENDDISGYYEHKALVTKADDHGERVMGCLSDDGTYCAFSEKFYTLMGQKFYSDGLLSVGDAVGNVGYIDERGTRVLGFDESFDRIKPFTEGYAAVFKNKRYSLVSKTGKKVKFGFSGVAEVSGGTNVFGGRVYVWDTTGKLYKCRVTSVAKCEKTKWPSQRTYDFLYRFAEITGVGKNVPMTAVESHGQADTRLTPYSADALWGYASDVGVAVPCQFGSAEAFDDGLAVVTHNGQRGLVKLIEGTTFEAEVPERAVPYFAGEKAICTFHLHVPSVWNDKSLEVMLTGNGRKYQLSTSTEGYRFTVDSQNLPTSCQLEVRGDGLLLYKAQLTFRFEKHVRCTTCNKDIVVCSYRGRHPQPKEKSAEGRKPSMKVCPTCGKDIRLCKYHGVHE